MGQEEVIEVTHAVLFPLLGDVEHLADKNSIPPSLMRASVTIQGTTNAIVTVDCSADLARRLGAAMFSAEPSSLSDEEVGDALGEIANIIGGNIKALLPGPSRLGLPELQSEVMAPPSSVIILQAFECAGEPFRVCLASRGPD